MNESATFSWTCYYHLHHLCFMSQPGVVPAVPAISKQYSRKIYQLQTVLSVNILKVSQLAFTARALCWLMLNFLSARTPDPFLLSCFLVSRTQHAHGVIPFQKQDFALALIPFSPSIQYRLFGAITTCHKPHCNRARIHPTFVVAVPTLRALSAYKRSITR